jgi:hypothetical protein
VPGRSRVLLVERLGEAQDRGEVGLALDVAATGGRPENSGYLRAVDHHAVAAEGLGCVQGLVGRRGEPGDRIGVLG